MSPSPARAGTETEIWVPPFDEATLVTLIGFPLLVVGFATSRVNQTSLPVPEKSEPVIVTTPPLTLMLLISGLSLALTPYTNWTPAWSSLLIERSATPLPEIEAPIVAPGAVLCPRPSACPYSCVATPWRSMPLPMLFGPSCQVQLL